MQLSEHLKVHQNPFHSWSLESIGARTTLAICVLLWVLSTGVALAEDPPPAEAPAAEEDTGCPDGQADCRPNFTAFLQLGWLVDTFSGDDLRTYLNPDDTSSTDYELTAGFSLAYRLMGRSWEPDKSQLWLYGHTVHGARSADVDCADQPDLSICEFASDPTGSDAGTIADSEIYLLTHATSLEVYTGLRWEPRAFRTDIDTPIRPYAKLELGFISLDEAGSEAIERHQVAVGFMLTRGNFVRSAFELGYGSSDLFVTNPQDRFKAHAILRWQTTKGFGAFAQMEVEIDSGTGSDSVRSMVGFFYDLSKPLLSSGT